jgi:hypothetical protein
MADPTFIAQLEQAYRAPASDADHAAVTRSVLAALGRADRRRRIVLAASAVLGTSVAGLVTLKIVPALDSAAYRALGVAAAAVRDTANSVPIPWAFALLGLALLASAVSRSLEDY